MLDGFRRIRDQLSVPERFAPEVEAEAAAAVADGPTTPPGAPTRVRDARDLPLTAIDPAGSRDLDQSYAAERRGDGHRVFYAIADVAGLVKPSGLVDTEARRRGLTLYSPDVRASLHPVEINEEAGSLLPDQDRQALLWTIDLDGRGEIQSAHLERAMVRTRMQLSYQEAQERIDNRAEDDPLHLLNEIGERRLTLERERGAVSLALPAQEVVQSESGTWDLEYDRSLPVEVWNAQISLLTGIAASRIMLDVGTGLLRTLPPPEARTVARIRRTARALGIDWPDHVDYATRVRELRPDTPASAALLSQAARGLRGAGYVAFHDAAVPDEPTHSAIASTYAHVTAPLRRLCDRFANEIIVAECAEREPPSWAVEALDELPSTMGAATQRDRSLERAVIDFVEAMILRTRVGDTFAAIVTDIDRERGRGRVQLRDPAVVARLPADGLELGAEVRVRLDAVDPSDRRVVFSAVKDGTA